MAAAEKISLRHGELTFNALACGNGPPVFCLHGFPDNLHTFDALLPALADAGFRGIAPAMRGYEPGSQPADRNYSAVALAQDVLAWADDIGAEEFHVVGHDWGAAVAYVVGAMAPDRIRSITAMAVPHAATIGRGVRKVPSQLLNSWYMTFFQLRGVAEYAVKRNDWALIKKLWRDWSPGYRLSEEEWASLRATFSAPGVLDAMLAYYRQNATPAKLLGWGQSPASALVTVPVPTLALTGSDDGCFDTRMFDHSICPENFPRGVHVERVQGVGHFLHGEAPQQVHALILNWLSQHQ
jgi:pimeloyl-ACP methyl ester carboxylesterase